MELARAGYKFINCSKEQPRMGFRDVICALMWLISKLRGLWLCGPLLRRMSESERRTHG